MLPLLCRLAQLLCYMQFTSFSILVPPALVCLWLKANLIPDYSFLLPSSLDLLPLPARIPLLCVKITVTLHREVATYFLMN